MGSSSFCTAGVESRRLKVPVSIFCRKPSAFPLTSSGKVVLFNCEAQKVQCGDRCWRTGLLHTESYPPYTTESSAHCGSYYTACLSVCTGGIVPGPRMFSVDVVYGMISVYGVFLRLAAAGARRGGSTACTTVLLPFVGPGCSFCEKGEKKARRSARPQTADQVAQPQNCSAILPAVPAASANCRSAALPCAISGGLPVY